MEWRKDQFVVSSEREQLNLAVIYSFLHNESYWAKGISWDTFKTSVDHSLCFGVYQMDLGKEPVQAGFARVITDYSTFAYLADVFILPEYRGKGLGKWLVAVITDYPDLRRIRRWMLLTDDAHGLYSKVGFSLISRPEKVMEKTKKGV